MIDFSYPFIYFNWWIPYHLIYMYVKPGKTYSVPLSCIAFLYIPLWGVTPPPGVFCLWRRVSLGSDGLYLWYVKIWRTLRLFGLTLFFPWKIIINLEIVIVCYCFQFCRDLYAACSSGNEWWGSCWKCCQDTWIWKEKSGSEHDWCMCSW